ncbi:MAG TPA: carboxypeptidase regulatory-like domain-containing protein [Vicinamibacterales bacterium]|nr:carboxypeptidase regulatory-like domain-containing protein [Vicinamibacterales bacterium]
MSKRCFVVVLLAAGISVPFHESALAQAPTASIAGRVVSPDGQPLPGVAISLTSPNLQGVRSTVSSDSGVYHVALLPPGAYTLLFELSSFQPVQRTLTVAGTQNAVVDVTLPLATLSVDVTVVGQAQPSVATARVATNFTQDLMATLPSNRTIDAALLMAPSVHATGPRGAFSIAGAQSYENLYTLNGAVIVENLRGSPYPLYIEDAIQEVTVATAGVSAEFGRFEGGMVSAVTKSGGNIFSGSFRTSFANDYWRSLTPAANDPKRNTAAPEPATNPMYEATFGGPVLKERLWFFGATRIRNEETSLNTIVTNIPYIRTNDEKRYEGKVTYTPRPNHSLQSSYINIDQVQTNFSPSTIRVMDLASLAPQRQPSDLLSLRYSGLVSPNFSIEVQYSRRHLTLDTGAPTRDRVNGTLLIDGAKNNRYFSPTFCGICEDEKRDNDDVIAKGSYFLSTRAFGAHHLVFGYDRFNDKIFQNAYQSGSDWRIQGTTSLLGSDGTSLFPQFLPNSTVITYTPVENVTTNGSNLRMHSIFFNDSWRWNNHFSFNAGLRWDKNQGQDGGGDVVANHALWSPRLSAIWDPKGDGRWALSASYARYVMPMTSNVAASTTAAGNASLYSWFYQGPAINPDPAGALVPSGVAIQQVFDWFERNGGRTRPTVAAFVPGVNVRILTPLKSPSAHEYAVGTSRQLGTRGTVRVDGTFRTYRDFYSQRVDLTTGRAFDKLGTQYDLFVVENTNHVKRRYSGLTTQATLRVADGLDVGGNYTLSRTWGNFDGETSASGPSVAQVDAFPEYKDPSWNAPEGDLAVDQRHRARIWATYVSPMPVGAGSLTFGLLQQVGSGVPYGAVGTGTLGVNAALSIPNPGYLVTQAPSGFFVDYYYTARDAFRTETTYRTDLSVNYAYKIRASRSQPELFFHGEVLNIFRDFQLCGCGAPAFGNGGATDLTTIGQAVRTSRNTPALQPFNPFTTTPVRGVNWDVNTTPGSVFGSALNHFAYTSPRIFRFSVGVRF